MVDDFCPCGPTDHNFNPLGAEFYKEYKKPDSNGFHKIDEITYQTILCSKCGLTREIVVKDYRIKKEPASIFKGTVCLYCREGKHGGCADRIYAYPERSCFCDTCDQIKKDAEDDATQQVRESQKEIF